MKAFWEGHDPTQGMRQGNDVGTQYRSAIYTSSHAQRDAAIASRERYQERLSSEGYGEYLAKNPGGYCGLGGTGVSCPVGLTRA